MKHSPPIGVIIPINERFSKTDIQYNDPENNKIPVMKKLPDHLICVVLILLETTPVIMSARA